MTSCRAATKIFTGTVKRMDKGDIDRGERAGWKGVCDAPRMIPKETSAPVTGCAP
jgi:hypothetical protein